MFMHKKNRSFIIIFVLFIFASCKDKNVLEPLLSSSINETRTSSNVFSVYNNSNLSFDIPLGTIVDKKTDVNDLFIDGSSIWIGSIERGSKTLFSFEKDIYGNIVLYSSSVKGDVSNSVLYERRSLMPAVIYDSRDIPGTNSVIMSVNSIFFLPLYDTFMDNDFNLRLDNVSGYFTNIMPAPYTISVEDYVGESNGLLSYIPTEELRLNIMRRLWESSKGGIRYKFLDKVNGGYALSTNGNDTKADMKGWDIWRYDGYNEVGSTNYVYVYDYLYMYILKDHAIKVNGEDEGVKSTVMLLCENPNDESKVLESSKFIKYNADY